MRSIRCLPLLAVVLMQASATFKDDGLPPWLISPAEDQSPIVYLGSSPYKSDTDSKQAKTRDESHVLDPNEIEKLEEEREMAMERAANDAEKELQSGPMDKRFLGHVLGGGFKFGKRSKEIPDPDLWKKASHNYGHVLGNGLAFGKRSAMEGDMLENVKRFGLVLGHGFKFGKRSGDETESIDSGDADGEYDDLDKRRFGGLVLGRGWKFGKRGAGEEEVEEDPRFLLSPADKRYGWVFGRTFGKRYHGDKRYGNLLGSGWKFGKRSDDDDVNNSFDDSFPLEKRFGNLFGRRWNFKRDGANKRFGFLLGRGLNFKKRTGTDLDDTSAVADTEDDYGDMDKRYSGRLFGGRFAFNKREYGRRLDNKRRFGYVIGGGFKFGKRQDGGDLESEIINDSSSSSSDGMDENKRGIGHILGHGFKFGKREAPFGGEKPIM